MSKRLFFAGVVTVVLLLSLLEPALSGWIHGSQAINFNGNPNVAITAIDTSGGIATSRTSCKTPCFIHLSASAITATGTSVPYQDLSYTWDMNDPTGTEVFTNAATGITVNANNGQTGPEAAYVYRNVGTGTFHPKLTITGKNGSNYTTAVVVHPGITVTAFSAASTWYYDANATGANNGTSAANAFTSLATVSSKVVGNNNVQIYLARGSDWLAAGSTDFIQIFNSTGVRISPTPLSIGANPIVGTTTNTSPADKFLLSFVTSGSGDVADAVVSNVDFKVTGNQFTGTSLVDAQVNNTNHSLANIYFDNSSFTTNMIVAHAFNGWVNAQFTQQTSSGNFDGFGIWGGSINSLPGDLAFGTAFFGGARNWHFIIGLTNVNGNGSSDGTYSALNHHFYQAAGNHVLNRWVNFASSVVSGVATRDMCAKIDNYPPPKYNVSAYSSGAGGAIRLTVPDTSQYTNGANVYIEGVTGTGFNDVVSATGGVVIPAGQGQGVWVASLPGGGDTTHIDLVGTTFNAGHTYIGGDVSVTGGTSYFLVDGNNATGTHSAFDSNNNWGNPYASWQSNYVIQGNAVHDMLTDSNMPLPIALSLTYRDNRHWANLTRTLIPSQGIAKNHAVIYRFYRNKFYTASSVPGGSGAETNVFNAAGVSWVNPQTLTDSIIVDMRTGAGAIALVSYASAAGWTVDRNEYYAPNATSNQFLYNATTATTFATWQAAGLDPNGQQLSTPQFNALGWTTPPTKWSDMNFLLKRDLNPASNDNDPMWLEKTA